MLIKLDKIKFLNNSNLGMVYFFVAGTNLDFEKVSKCDIFFWSIFSCIWTEYGDLRSKTFATRCLFTDHLNHKTVNKATCRTLSASPHQLWAH